MRFLVVCLFVFHLMGKSEWGGNPVCWLLRLYFSFVCCLDDVSAVCNWWLGDAGSYIQVVYFVWVLTLWYSLELVLWYSRSWSQCSPSKGSGLDLWPGRKIPQWFVMALSEIKTNIQKWETKDKPQINGTYKIRQLIINNKNSGVYTYTYTFMSKVKTVQLK